MVSYLNRRTVTVLKSAISNQVSIYKSKNCVISYILVDSESRINVAIPYRNDLGIVVKQTAKNDPEIVRACHTLEERLRVVWNSAQRTIYGYYTHQF